jgi:hypothetical protein
LLRPIAVVRWWIEHRLDRAELLADRLALHEVGATALAGALWTVQCPARQWAVGFGEAGSSRVAQLLGDPPSRQWPPSAVWARSALGIILMIGISGCFAGGAISVL